MSATPFSCVFLIAVISAGLMGYAIQRGATCTVAAIGEIVHNGKFRRLKALAETAFWVAGGILIARALGALPMLPSGFPLSAWTVLGGVLLGLGAYLNGACLFGAIARFGSGDWAQLCAPLGFYLGLVSFMPFFQMGIAHAQPTMAFAPMSNVGLLLALLFFGYFAWRAWQIFAPQHSPLPRLHRIWQPHEATLLIGVAFVVLLVTFGFWTYTDLLADLSQHKVRNVELRILLFIALFVGAALGGWTAGRFKLRGFGVRPLITSSLGGLLMGWGGALTPGGNDWLILVGMPLFWPYAWVAVFAMGGTIFAAFKIEQRFKSH